MAGFTVFDGAVIALALISGFLAMYRGLTREVLSITSWAIAALATFYAAVVRKDWAEQLANEVSLQLPIAQVAIGAVVFIVTLIVVHLITGKISDMILDSNVGIIDRTLGLGFGLLRGVLLVAVVYLIAFKFLGFDNQPDWVANAQTRGAIDSTAQSIESLVEQFIPESLRNPNNDTSEQQG